jgi:hypothetical protein
MIGISRKQKEKTSAYIRARTGQQGDTNEWLLSRGDAVEISPPLPKRSGQIATCVYFCSGTMLKEKTGGAR